MSLLDKLKKNSTLKTTQVLADSDFFSNKNIIPTDIPALNIALSGSALGGYGAGLIFLAAPSAHFKSLMGLKMVAAYLKKYDDAVCLFYDSEFGITPEYLASMGVDPSRVVHTPVTDIEQLKFDTVQQLENIQLGDHVIIFIDSVGNLASKKEVEDAKDQKSVADMSRAKSLKSYFRIITPHLTTKNITAIAINHVYADMGCLDGDTKVLMHNGEWKALSEVCVGDYVVTDDGIKQKVLATYGPDELQDKPELFGMFKITMENGEVIHCTGNHKFLLTNGEWEEARYLTEDDKLKTLQGKYLKIMSICGIEPRPVYDITVEERHTFVIQSNIITHNSMFPKTIMSGGCLLAGTQIRMADGSLKNIEDVEVGDEVQTHKEIEKVLNTWTPETLEEGFPECVEIEWEDGTKVVCSLGHKFMVNGEWVEARHLTAGTDVDVI